MYPLRSPEWGKCALPFIPGLGLHSREEMGFFVILQAHFQSPAPLSGGEWLLSI